MNVTDTWTRRRLLQVGGISALGLPLSSPLRATGNAGSGRSRKQPPQPFQRYSDLLETIEKRGHQMRVLGYAPDHSPIVAVKAGGEKKPAIFISAGSHCTEHAGVAAAVELIDKLETKHQLYVIPSRDPIGLNGYGYALGLNLDKTPQFHSSEEAETLLRKQGEVLYDENGILLVLIGETGYANRGLYRRFKKGDPFLEPLKGRRIYFPSRYKNVEGTAPFQRAYTLIVTPDAEVLHLNRFHDTPWAPVEARCARRLMAEIQPGLTFDLHEHGGNFFWFSARHQRNDEDELLEQRMAREAIRAVAASGTRLAPEKYRPGGFFSKMERGVFMLDAKQRGEGLNMIDFAARKHGPGFTVETGMRGSSFQNRVKASMLTVQTAVRVFEEHHA